MERTHVAVVFMFHVQLETGSRKRFLSSLLFTVSRGAASSPARPSPLPIRPRCTRLPSLVARVGFEPAPENDKRSDHTDDALHLIFRVMLLIFRLQFNSLSTRGPD